MNNNHAINDKLKNLINVSSRDYCINSSSKTKHFLINDKFPFNDLVSFFSDENSVLKYDESYGLSKLYGLSKQANTFLKETGNWPLFMSRYFLCAKTKDKKSIYAPLLLKKIRVEKTISSFSIYVIDNEYVVNEKLLTFIEREWDVKLNDFFQNKEINISEYINQLQILLNKRIEIFSNNEDKIFFDDESVYIKDDFIIGIYEPGGGKLKDDLLSIINEGIDPFESTILNGQSFYKEQEINDEPIVQISNNLNLYQKYAIRSALNENTVIHGPPGTGKSEVISNIIINILLNNHNALIVSEKKAALDVVVERIKSLSLLTLSLYDDIKCDFYDSIIALSNYLGTDWLSTSFNELSFNIIDHIKISNEYRNLLKFKTNINDFAKKIIMINDFNQNSQNLLYTFWNKLNQFGIKEYLTLKNNDDINFLQTRKNDKSFFDDLNKQINFVKKYHLNQNQEKYNTFKNFANEIKEYYKQSELTPNEYLKMISENVYRLDEIISQLENKNDIFNELKNNYNYISDIFLEYQKIISEYKKLIDQKYFDVIKNANFKEFLIKYNKILPSNKKIFIKEYVDNHQILEKIPLFKKSAKIDDDVLSFYNKLFINNYLFLNQSIIDNIELFNKSNILALFNHQLLDEKILAFLSSDFALTMNFKELNFIIEKNITKEKLETLNILINYQENLKINNLEINNNLIDELLSNNQNFAINTDTIFELYLKRIKYALSTSTPETKEKVKELLRIVHLKKRPSMYKILENYGTVLRILFPIWFIKPEAASLFLPLEKGLFDYGIFDEASQMFLEKSFPLVYRVKKAIVAGDEKQLKPSSFFMSLSSDEEQEYDLLDTNVAESLLEKSQASLWNSFILKNHYRSLSKDLIEFSNKYIYNNELIFASVNDNNNQQYGLETINVNGYFNNGVNQVECDKVIDVLKTNIDKYNKIVIITFNALQSKFIEKAITKMNDPKIFQKMELGLLVITNLENVQGNEGDLVIISVAYAKKDDFSKLHANFGPLISDGGSNRLNVAITRAKEKMIVIKSFEASDITITQNNNLLTFRNFIAWLDTKKDDVLSKPSSSIKNDFSIFLNKLVNKYNLQIAYNIEIGSDQINYAIVNNQKIIFTINFRDINFYHNLIDVNEDIDKTIFLRSRKYHLHLINEWEWLLSRDKIKNYLENLLINYMKE